MEKFIEENFSWADKHTLNDKLIIPKKIKLQVLDFPQFYGKPLEDVKKHLEENYARRLPDLRVYRHVWEHLDDYPELKKFEWQFSFFFGSLLRGRGGDWHVPRVDWDGAKFGRLAGWLGSGWVSGYRVVMLHSDLDPLTSAPDDFLNIALAHLKNAELEITKVKELLKK